VNVITGAADRERCRLSIPAESTQASMQITLNYRRDQISPLFRRKHDMNKKSRERLSHG